MYACMYVCVCIYIYIETYIYIYICVCVCVRMCVYIYICPMAAGMVLVRRLERIGFSGSRAFWFFRVGGELQPHLLKSDRLTAA